MHPIEESQNSKLAQIRKQMKQKRQLVAQALKQCQQNNTTQRKDKGEYDYWSTYSKQKKIQIKNDIISTQSTSEQPQHKIIKQKKPWEYLQTKYKFVSKVLPLTIYYPPSCSGYDMAYCKVQDAIYVYGGISCSSDLTQGMKQHFYKFYQGKWSQVKPQSIYNPIPRYGHTLTAYQRDLILYGGVSEYKQKLKDRCFYTDCSVYNTVKNNWRIIETTGHQVKTRKNHAACVYSKYFIVFGGVNQMQEVVNQISWINFQNKKPRWKSAPFQGRFNHKMLPVQTQSGRDFLCVFGGRDSNSQIVNTFFILPLTIVDGDLYIKQFTIINHQMSPRQMPIMAQFLQGFIIMGGINENSEIVGDTWYYSSQKQSLDQVKLNIKYSDLRGAKGASLYGQKVYILTGNSMTCKAISLQFQK